MLDDVLGDTLDDVLGGMLGVDASPTFWKPYKHGLSGKNMLGVGYLPTNSNQKHPF